MLCIMTAIIIDAIDDVLPVITRVRPIMPYISAHMDLYYVHM